MNRAANLALVRHWRTAAAIAVAAWLVIELLLIGQAMHTDSFDVWEAIKMTVPRSAMSMVFAPLAVCLAFLFPMERGRIARSVLAHLSACALLMAAIHHAVVNFADGPNAVHEPPASVTPPVHQSGNPLHSRSS